MNGRFRKRSIRYPQAGKGTDLDALRAGVRTFAGALGYDSFVLYTVPLARYGSPDELVEHLLGWRATGPVAAPSSPSGASLAIACRSRKLIVELDGRQHAVNEAADAVQTSYLKARGWRVGRFSNNAVLENIQGVLRVILADIAVLGVDPLPTPPLQGGG